VRGNLIVKGKIASLPAGRQGSPRNDNFYVGTWVEDGGVENPCGNFEMRGCLFFLALDQEF